jgi:hypothetical protein
MVIGHLYLYFSINDLLSQSGEKLVSEANAMFVSGWNENFRFRIFTKIPIFTIFAPKISKFRLNFAKETLEGVTKK